MAADSGAGQLRNDLDVADTRGALTGELDLATVQVLRGAADVLMSETAHEITIDLGRLQFIDAAGLGEVVRLRLTLIAAGRRLILSEPSPRIRRIFVMGRLAELIYVTGTDRVTEMNRAPFFGRRPVQSSSTTPMLLKAILMC